MSRPSRPGPADVEVGLLPRLVPGSRILLWYSDDDVWHEALIALRADEYTFFIFTPDQDLYATSLACDGGDGPTKVRSLNHDFQVPSTIRQPVYRFRSEISDTLIKQQIREAHRMSVEEGYGAVLPSVVQDAAGRPQTLDEFFGGAFLSRRMTGKPDERRSQRPTEPVLPKNAGRVQHPPDGFVWVAAEPLGGLVLGQEVSLNEKEDVQVGTSTALALRSGVWVKVEMISMTEASDYPRRRRALFAQPASEKIEKELLKEEKPAVASKPASDEGDSEGDVRTLWVDVDEHGERYKRWRDLCAECFTPVFDAKPIEGPSTALHVIKHMERQGGDPRLWLQSWTRAKHIESTDRTYFEMKTITDSLFYAGTYDQVNIPALMCLEVQCRRLQAIVEAYTNPTRPSWENAKLFTGQAQPEDIVSPTFRTYAVKKNKDELELLQARQKVRELRGAPATAQEDQTGDTIDALPKKTAKPKTKGKGRGFGQDDAQ